MFLSPLDKGDLGGWRWKTYEIRTLRPLYIPPPKFPLIPFPVMYNSPYPPLLKGGGKT